MPIVHRLDAAGSTVNVCLLVTEEEARQRVIRSMCPDKVCRTCGEPSRRIVQHERELFGGNIDSHSHPSTRKGAGNRGIVSSVGGTGYRVTSETLGWSDCGHDDWRPGVWLDPFAET